MMEAILWAFEYFEAMDRANAKIHCAPVKYSPITFRLATYLQESWPEGEDITQEIARVLHHIGKYEEDMGR